ncbi:MAG: DUF502 domain-containing protein [Pseudomonadales bacterium]
MNNAIAIFWKGLATLLPLAVTMWILYFAVVTVERTLSQLVPEAAYFPGSGLLLGIVITGAFGALMHFFLFERLVDFGSSILNRIPVVKSFYSALQDFFGYLGHRSTEELSRVVLVTFDHDCRLIGFVTNPRFDAPLQDGAAGEERISVYLPMSYQLGGYMVLLPASRVEPLEMSVEDAMRLVLTAGVRSN